MTTPVLPDPNAFCTTRQLSEVLGLTQRQIERLTASRILKVTGGKLQNRYRLAAAVQSYLTYQKQYISEQAKVGDDAYMRARTRRMEAAAAITELELKSKQGEYLRRDDVEFEITLMITACRQRLLAIPNKVMHRLLGLTKPIQANQIITAEIYSALTQLSESKFNAAGFRKERAAYLESQGIAGDVIAKMLDRDGENPPGTD